MEIPDLEQLLQLTRNSNQRRTWRCPSELSLAEYVDGRSPKGRKRRIEKHVSDCTFCLHHIALLKTLPDAERGQVPSKLLERVESLVKSGREWTFPRFRWNWVAPASIVACGLFLASLIWLNGPDQSEVVRPLDPASYQELRNGTSNSRELRLLEPADGAVVDSETVYFRWELLNDALFYEVDVVDLEGDPAWTARVDTSETVIPESARLPSGEYFVVVRAVMKDGRLSSGKFTRFSVR